MELELFLGVAVLLRSTPRALSQSSKSGSKNRRYNLSQCLKTPGLICKARKGQVSDSIILNPSAGQRPPFERHAHHRGEASGQNYLSRRCSTHS